MHERSEKFAKRRFIIAIILISLLTICGAFFFFRYQVSLIRADKYGEIRAIARLKSEEIIRWLSERHSDADYFSSSKETKLILEKYRETNKASDVRKDFDVLFKRMKQNHHYEEILIVDIHDRIIYSNDSTKLIIDSSLMSAIHRVKKEKRIILNDFSYNNSRGFIHLDMVAPIKLSENEWAFLVFIINPSTFLYPLVQSWPTPSKSSETLLLRKEGKNLLYLNPLKHAPDAALKLTEPVSESSFPPADAINGMKECFEGKDYTGTSVIADIRAISDTPWLMVAKINKSEVFSELKFRLELQALMLILLLLFIGSTFAMEYNRNQKSIYEKLFLREQEFRVAQEEFRNTLKKLNADLEQRVELRTEELKRSNKE